MITCTRFESMFPNAVAGKLTPEEAAEFAEHRTQCRHCAGFTEGDAYYRMRLQTVGFEPNAPQLDLNAIYRGQRAPQNRTYNLPMRTLSLAAGIVLGAFVVGKVLLNNPATLSTPGAINQANRIDTALPATPAQQFVSSTDGKSSTKPVDSVKNKNQTTQPIPDQFHGSMQSVSGK